MSKYLNKKINIEEKDFHNAKIEEHGLAVIIHFVSIFILFHETTPGRYKHPQANILIYQQRCISILRSDS